MMASLPTEWIMLPFLTGMITTGTLMMIPDLPRSHAIVVGVLTIGFGMVSSFVFLGAPWFLHFIGMFIAYLISQWLVIFAYWAMQWVNRKRAIRLLRRKGFSI